MAWNQQLTILRDVLVDLFPRRDNAELVVDEAAIPRERIRFSEQGDVNWHEIVSVADRMSLVPSLIEAALARYPQDPRLRHAASAFLGMLGSQVPSTAQEQAQSAELPPTPVDLAIVTAMPEELDPILEVMGGRETWREFTLDRYLHRWKRLEIEGVPCTVVSGSLWKYGGDAVANEVGRLQTLRPRMMAMSGICAGWESKDDVMNGDLIVCERAFNPREGKYQGTEFHSDTVTVAPPPWLVLLLKDFGDRPGWSDEIAVPRPNDIPRRGPKVHIATFASDVPILAVENPFEAASRQVRKVRAYDLEVKSFLNAAMERGIPAFAVKGVSDYATPSKGDHCHAYSAAAAATWLAAFTRSTYRHWPRP
jgi:nucleoside phosphorylase